MNCLPPTKNWRPMFAVVLRFLDRKVVCRGIKSVKLRLKCGIEMKKLLLLSSSTSYSFSGVTAGLVTSDHSELLQHPAKLGLG